MKPWAELRIPSLERDIDSLRKTKPAELALLRATNTLLFSYLYAGREADAVKLAEEVIARQKANGWRTDAETVAAYGGTVKAVALAGQPDLAVEMSMAVLGEVKKKADAPRLLVARATFDVGFARSHAGEHADAEGHFREALRLQTEADSKHWTAAKYKAWLGFALHDQKKYDEAEPVLTEAYAESVKRMADTPAWERHLPATASGKLVELYERQEKPEEVKKWQAERAKYGPSGTDPAEGR
jgi:tetratricopeptide (TPR) repeat protein